MIEDCLLRLDLDDTLISVNDNFVFVSRANRMIFWVVRNFISQGANVVRKYKTQIKPYTEYCT